jgi:Ca-activated chloride channel family protein
MRSPTLIGLLLLASTTPGAAAAEEPSPQTALEAYRRGDFQRSESQYSELAKKNPDDPRLRFNAGAAAYRRNDLTNAANWFEGVTAAPDLKLQQQAYYNLGNTRYRLGESATDPEARKSHWYHALTNYMSAIKLDGADTNASSNYSFVRQQLEQLERQQPPPQSSQSKDKSQQDKKQQQQKQDSQDSESSKDQQDQKDQKGQKDQEQQQDNSGSQQQQQQDSQGGEQSEQSDNESAQSTGSKDQEGSKPEDPKDQAADKKAGQEDSQKGAQSPGQKSEDGSQGKTGQAVEAGEGEEGAMSASQAVQMLESQKGEEKALLLRAYGSGKEAAERAARIRKPW